jgi:hypothetical protein
LPECSDRISCGESALRVGGIAKSRMLKRCDDIDGRAALPDPSAGATPSLMRGGALGASIVSDSERYRKF